MNAAKYSVPGREERKEVTLEMFCKDCEEDSVACKKDVVDCIKEAKLYKNFVMIKND